MERANYDDIAKMERTNWWYAARRQILENQLTKLKISGASALDIGCGVGSNLPALKPYAAKATGLDISAQAIQYAKSCGYDELIEASAESLPIQEETMDVVICMDVLEHLDDQKTVKEIFRVLKKGGTLVVTVPAFSSLWNGNDDYSHHLRRYSRKELYDLLTKNGFSVQQISYWNFLFFLPVWFFARFYKTGDSTSHKNNLSFIPACLNYPLMKATSLERLISRVFPIPFGVSLYAVATK